MKGFTATMTRELRGSHQLPPGKEKLQLPISRRSPTKAQGEKSDKARGRWRTTATLLVEAACCSLGNGSQARTDRSCAGIKTAEIYWDLQFAS